MNKYLKLTLLAMFSNLSLLVIFRHRLGGINFSQFHYLLFSVVPLTILILIYLKNFSSKILLLLGIIFVTLNILFYGLWDRHGFNMNNGWTMIKAKQAAEYIRNDVKKEKYNITMLFDGESRAYPLRYFLNRTENKPQGEELYGDILERLYVVSSSNIDVNNVTLWEVTSFRPFKIVKDWPLGEGYQLFRLEKLKI